MSASSFVVQDIYGASPQTFSLLFGLNSIGIVGIGQLNGKVLVGRVPMDRVLAVGLALITAASLALVLLTTWVFVRASLAEVVRVRYYLIDMSVYDAVVAAAGEAFGTIRPAATMVLSGLTTPEMKVEIEVTARIGASKS